MHYLAGVYGVAAKKYQVTCGCKHGISVDAAILSITARSGGTLYENGTPSKVLRDSTSFDICPIGDVSEATVS